MFFLRSSICYFICFCIHNLVIAYPTSTEALVVNSGENNLGKEGSIPESDALIGNNNNVLKITEMRIFSNISNRFAHTLVRSKVKNFGNVSKEATFSLVLPDSAYISGLVMEIKGKNYTAYVKEKEEAKKIYNEAVASGIGAGHVAVDTRDSNVFTISVNVESESKVIFYLTYEELLKRQNGRYEHIINIRPGQPIKDLGVEVAISESRPLKNIKAPPLRSGNEIGSEKEELDPRANIEIVNSTSAVITFAPTVQRQRELAKYLGTNEDEGLAGQFVVQYDVERDPSGGEVLLNDGFFVHFFAPTDLKPLPKYVVFVLDTSGSMYGKKIEQLRNAMINILGQLQEFDKFSLVEFNSHVTTWNVENSKAGNIYVPWRPYYGYEGTTPKSTNIEELELPPAFPATADNIQKAKNIVSEFRSDGGTSAYGGLEVGLRLVEREKDKIQPLIIFLTDGHPTDSSGEEIVKKITERNSNQTKSIIFTLSFGEDADKDFLRKLALQNSGFSKHIYVAADASLQLQDFYNQISSLLLTNVTFKYTSAVTKVTTTKFPVLFDGSELVVAGRYDYKLLDTSINKEKEIVLPVAGWSETEITLKPVVEHPITNLERIWSYLTIKQLLEQEKVSKEPEKLKKQALDLALKYSFVTPVSSLVVVKPNETDAVDAESTSRRGREDFPISAIARGGSVHLKIPHHGMAVALAIPASAPIPQRFIVSGFADSALSVEKTYLTTPYFPTSVATTTASTPETSSATITTMKTVSKATPNESFSEIREKLFKEYPWLLQAVDGNSVLISGSKYDIGFDASVPTVDECMVSSTNSTGKCSLLKDCKLASSFLTSVNDLNEYFCPLGNFLGVCCPDDTSSKTEKTR